MSQTTAAPRLVAAEETPVHARQRSKLVRPILMLGGIAVVAVASFLSWLNGGRYVSIDNAYVRAAKVAVTTDVSGTVTEVNVREGQRVKTGDVLFRLSSYKFEIAMAGAQANLDQVELSLRAMKVDYQRMLRDIEAQQAKVQADQAAFERYGNLVKGGGVTRSDYDDIRFRLAANTAVVGSLTELARVQLAKLGGNPDVDAKPFMKDYDIEMEATDRMLLDALIRIKEHDDTLSLRRSCREGVCGSDAMNINGKNGLACITKLADLKEPVVIRPLPGLPVIRDLIVDMSQFFKQYHSIKPYLQNDTPAPEKERLQSPADREELNGLYECILCACCSTACPSFWWNPDKFVGPAGLLQAYRFIADTRDEAINERLDNLEDPYRLFRCHSIMNCVDVCPKGLNPTKAIGKIKEMMVKRAV